MQSSNINSQDQHSISKISLGVSQNVAAGFKDNDSVASFSASQFIVTRAGAISLQNAEGQRELRKVRLHTTEENVRAPHEISNARLSSLAELTSDLQDDIETINRSLSLIGDKLNRQGNESEIKELAQCRQRIQRLSQWTQSVIDASLVRQGKIETCYRWANIFQWLSNEQTRWAQLARTANVALDCAIHIDLISRIWTDTEIVQRILENLVVNAISVSGPNQKIQIVAELSKDEEPWLIISVIDSSSSTLPDLTYDRLRPHFIDLSEGLCPLRGHGLGLAVCMQLARLLDGYLDFSSMAARGTRFDLHLPAGGILAWLRRQNRKTPTKSSPTPLQVLHVDSRSAEFKLDELELLGQAIQITVRNQADVLQLDDETWIIKGRETPIDTTVILSQVKSNFLAIAPSLAGKAENLRLGFRSMGDMRSVMNCIETAITRSTSQLGQPAATVPIIVPKEDLTVFETITVRPSSQQLPFNTNRRIDRTHGTRKTTRVAFRNMNDDANSSLLRLSDDATR